MGDTFRSYALKGKGGKDVSNAIKALVTESAQVSSNGRMFAFEDINNGFLEREASTKIPFEEVVESHKEPEVISELEEFAEYREKRRRTSISDDEKEKRDEVLDRMMEEVEPVFENYIEDRNIPYNELEEGIPEMPEDLLDSEIQKELEELKNLVESRREGVSSIELDPLSLVELYRVPGENLAVAGGDHTYEVNGQRNHYNGVEENQLLGLNPQLVSKVKVQVNKSRELNLFSRLPEDKYMEEATEIVEQYRDEFS